MQVDAETHLATIWYLTGATIEYGSKVVHCGATPLVAIRQVMWNVERLGYDIATGSYFTWMGLSPRIDLAETPVPDVETYLQEGSIFARYMANVVTRWSPTGGATRLQEPFVIPMHGLIVPSRLVMCVAHIGAYVTIMRLHGEILYSPVKASKAEIAAVNMVTGKYRRYG